MVIGACVMSSLFDQDSGLMKGCRYFVDVIYLNVLLVVTCLPIFTIGAALTAAHDVVRCRVTGRGGGLLHVYLHSLKRNFGQATAVWLSMFAIALTLLYMWIIAGRSVIISAMVITVALLWVITFIWVWNLQSVFDNIVPCTLRNALLIGITHPLHSIAVVVICGGYWILTFASSFYLPQGLVLLLAMGIGLTEFAVTPILDHVLRTYR